MPESERSPYKKDPPSWRWFQTFMKDRPELFRTLKTKAIARVRVTAADVEEVKDWFNGFRTWCKERDIQPGDVLNFDEAGFRVGVAPGEDIVVWQTLVVFDHCSSDCLFD
jgi:hypothetical protein